uniref:L-lactate dehydrogenase n=2 Tax=Rhodosorus marinus TaxID=101924 RepID=A0A7S3EA12_9RHOD|mmetsp:Transcript_20563/g.83436  ORF Transcript_20563/g.83436 Transcript_20563/m.83436 type:complete len:326 (+) Transcript_20563:117-1094(+)
MSDDAVLTRRPSSLNDFSYNPLEDKYNTVAVIGAGGVGAACASNCILLKACSEVLLVDIAEDRCEGEALDLQDAGFVTGVRCKHATYEEAGQADVIVITAGVGQKPGEPRTSLIGRNYAILKSIFKSMEPLNPDAVILVVSNPCDVLTYLAQKLSGLDRNQVFGSGTFLDSQRFRIAVSHKLKVSPSAVNAFVLGEHGDSQFAATSTATIGGVPFSSFPELTPEFLKQAEADARNRAYEIIAKKGATYHGIGACVATMVDCIFLNERLVFPLSVRDSKANVCVSQPAVLGRSGIEAILPIPMSDEEKKLYDASCGAMRAILDEVA